MILNNTTNNVTGNVGFSDFSIEMNSTMFKMLSANVYNDVILAPIREWSTNAIDACLEAGNPIKFDVHLPTATEPSFSVRDYGTGLPADAIEGLFSVFGASTKRESNQYNGTFGIGRMSALAYTTQFTVESFYNGQHITYIVTSENSIPKMAHMGTVPTQQSNGLKLSLPVEIPDIKSFHTKASFLYKFFEHKPSLNIDLDITLKKTASGTNWYTTAVTAQPMLVMGNVPYSINTAELGLSGPIVLQAPLGTVSITPGRESLTYDKTTKDFLKQAVDTLKTEFSTSYQMALNGITSDYWSKLREFNKTISSLNYDIRGLLKLSVPNHFPQELTLNNRHGNLCFELDSDKLPSNTVIGTISCYSKFRNAANYYGGVSLNNTPIMIADTRTNLQEAAKLYAEAVKADPNNPYNSSEIILFKQEKFRKTEKDSFVTAVKAMLDTLGVSYELSSTYVTDSTGPTGSKFTEFTPHLLIVGTNNISASQGSYSASLFTDKIPYLPCSGFNVEYTDKQLAAANYLDYHHKTHRIYGVPKKYISEVEANDNFVPLLDYVDDLHQSDPLIQYTNPYRDHIWLDRQHWIEKHKHIMPSAVKTFYHAFKDVVDRPVPAIITNYFNINTVKPVVSQDTLDELEKYMLVPKLAYDSRIKSDELKHYIDLVGNQK